jgi:NAD(P)H-hydrate epimerase
MEGDVKLVSTAEMQQVEREADANGLSYEMMMEHAGSGLAEHADNHYRELREAGVLGLVGSGNNGGDTLVALAKMAEWGWKATAYIVRTRAEIDPLVERLRSSGGVVIDGAGDEKQKLLKGLLKDHAVLMDGILGTGISLPLRGSVKDVLGATKKYLSKREEKLAILAVDCPSGVDCDSGEAAQECLAADLTVTMAAVKQGLLRFPANDLVGDLQLVGIGLKDMDERSPTWQAIKRRVVTAEMVKDLLPVRRRDAHKGTFGTALIIAGSINYTGAALLAGESAYRVGVGLVTMGVPFPLYPALAGQFPEGTWLLLPHEMGVIAESAVEVVHENLGNSTSILIGPGFGMEDTTKNFLKRLFSDTHKTKKSKIGFVSAAETGADEPGTDFPPVVIDADGLKLVSQLNNWTGLINKPAVLTPHPGEMAVMTGLDVKQIQDERLEVAETYANRWGHIVVLKGANTIVAEPGGRTAVIPVADPALARAGSGDVLAGVITGLRAQGLAPYESAICGAWIHAQSGLLAARSIGTNSSVLAGDIITAIPGVLGILDR